MLATAAEPVEVELAWGLPLRVHAGEAIGYSIRTTNVFDPCASEVVHRLVDPADTAVDVGANIGYMTSIMVGAAGASGSVYAYEPHPLIFDLLIQNMALWERRSACRVTGSRLALSNRRGSGILSQGSSFHQNMGTARLADSAACTSAEDVHVELARLDDVLGDTEVGLVKVDVEGAEAAVFEGAEELLRKRAIRDVIFEEHGRYPTASTAVLERHGFTVFALDSSLFSLRLRNPGEIRSAPAWPGQSFLATIDVDRAVRRLERPGWTLPGIEPTVLTWARRRL